MSERDLFFAVMIGIALTSLIVIVVQVVRSRRGRSGDSGRSGNWWEGPWDEDDKR